MMMNYIQIRTTLSDGRVTLRHVEGSGRKARRFAAEQANRFGRRSGVTGVDVVEVTAADRAAALESPADLTRAGVAE